MHSAPEEILTERLLLRKPRLSDGQLVYDRYASDPEVRSFLLFPPPKGVEDSNEFIERCLSVWKKGTAYPYAIERSGDGEFLGMVEIRMEGHKADIGYVIARDAWGQGYASEAAKVLVDWALGQKQIYRVWAFCDAENKASARVMEKAGLKYEGRLKRYIVHRNISSEPRDALVYAKTK
jgi:RimJ/RimL family protein N-acetyltransferase